MEARFARVTRAGLPALLLSLGLAGCGGGAPTETLPDTSGPQTLAYTGPPPATPDVQAFRINVWENLRSDSRCGACHGAGSQAPTFVDFTDVNAAYGQANTVVNLSDPAASRMVTKVGEGHNCWLTSLTACADTLTAFIGAWAGNSASGGTTVRLTAPDLLDPGQSRNFPPTVGETRFASTVHPLLTQHCSRCHVEDAAVAQAPFFADADPAAAYDAAQEKINLDLPAQSRFVVRLDPESHNCWTDDCAADSDAMLAAIQELAGAIPPTEVDPVLVTSKAVGLNQGIIASSGGRHETNQIAFWQFKTGSGRTAFDTSGVEPAINLNLVGNVSWVGGWGLRFADGGRAQGPTRSSAKLAELIGATGEYSLEAWVAPGNVAQEGPARIVSYSGGNQLANFTLGQTQFNYDFLARSDSAGVQPSGEPALSTPDGEEVLQATLQHVVLTYDPVAGRRIYVNGELASGADPVPGGGLADWDDSFALVLGNEVSGERPWEGVVRMAAIHNRVLTPEQIVQNLEVGVGQKFFLLFGVSELVGLPESFIVFQVSEFDSFGYLFSEPAFISLDGTVEPGSVPLQGMRIGINGQEAAVGQAYANLDLTLNPADYEPGEGQPLSRLGTVIAKQKGPDDDEFFLTFERLGSEANVRVEPVPGTLPLPGGNADVPSVGLRTFDEINATLAEVTGVAPSAVRGTFETVRQQLPSSESIEGFLASHQTAVSQLAIAYCDALVDDPALRSSYFPDVEFGSAPGTALGTDADRDDVANPLLEGIMGSGLATQPDPALARGELRSLMQGLVDSCSAAAGCSLDAQRTATIVKASCAALAGSAVTLIQ